MKRVNAFSSATESSTRSTRLNVSWLGGAVLEFKDGPKKTCLLDTELRYLDAGFRPAKHSSKSDEQYLAQVMACIDIARIRYRLKYSEEIAHPNAPKTIRTFGRIHISMNRKDWSTQTRFPWGLPEFGNIIVQVGNSRLGCAGLESVLPVVIIDSGPAQTGTPE